MGSCSDLLERDYKYFEAAHQAALKSDFKTRVGAVAVYRGKVIASASSSEKTNPLQYVYNRYRDFAINGSDCLPKLHAEIGLVTKLRKMQNVDMKRVNVYVYRVCKSKPFSLARPCAGCIRALRSLGIKSVYYTTEYNGYAHEWIDVDKGIIDAKGA